MIELDVSALRAPVPVLTYERALAAVALPDRAPDGGWNVADGLAALCLAESRLIRRGEAPLLELRDQSLDGHLEHGRDVPRRQLVAEEFLRIAQVLVQLLVNRNLQRKPLRRKRFHDRTILRSGRSLRRLNCPQGQFGPAWRDLVNCPQGQFLGRGSNRCGCDWDDPRR